MKKIKHSLCFWHVTFILITAAAIVAVVMLLWNWLAPSIFGFGTISYWQAAGIFILARILFGGWGKSFNNKPGLNHNNLMHEKWRKMTDKEREEFINQRRKYFFHRHCSNRQGFNEGLNENNGKSGDDK